MKYENLWWCLISIGFGFITCGLSIIIPLLDFGTRQVTLNTLFAHVSKGITYIMNLDIRLVLGICILAIGCAVTNSAGLLIFKIFKQNKK